MSENSKSTKQDLQKKGGGYMPEAHRNLPNLRGGVITVNVIWELHTFREMAGMTFNLITRALKLIFNDD
jgi:hypothetical protein